MYVFIYYKRVDPRLTPTTATATATTNTTTTADNNRMRGGTTTRPATSVSL